MPLAIQSAFEEIRTTSAIAARIPVNFSRWLVSGTGNLTHSGGYHELSVGSTPFPTWSCEPGATQRAGWTKMRYVRGKEHPILDRAAAQIISSCTDGHVEIKTDLPTATVVCAFPVRTSTLGRKELNFVTTQPALHKGFAYACPCAAEWSDDEGEASDVLAREANSIDATDYREPAQLQYIRMDSHTFHACNRALASELRYGQTVRCDHLGYTPMCELNIHGYTDQQLEYVARYSSKNGFSRYQLVRLKGVDGLLIRATYARGGQVKHEARRDTHHASYSSAILRSILDDEHLLFDYKSIFTGLVGRAPVFVQRGKSLLLEFDGEFFGVGHTDPKAILRDVFLRCLEDPDQIPQLACLCRPGKAMYRQYHKYGVLQYLNADVDLARYAATAIHDHGPMNTRQISEALMFPDKAVLDTCLKNSDLVCRTGLVTSETPWHLTDNATFIDYVKDRLIDCLHDAGETFETVVMTCEIPSKYLQMTLRMTGSATGNTNINWFSTRFRTAMERDPNLDKQKIDVLINAYTIIAYCLRNQDGDSTLHCKVVDYGLAHGMADLEAPELYDARLAEVRPNASRSVIASFDATKFSGLDEDVRCVVSLNDNLVTVDKPCASYKCLQVTPNFGGTPGPLSTDSGATLLSALLRHFCDGTKTTLSDEKADIVTMISKRKLPKDVSEAYDGIMAKLIEADLDLLRFHCAEGSLSADCQTPPAKFTEQQVNDLYDRYTDFYTRFAGPGKSEINVFYALLGLSTPVYTERLSSFLKKGETDDRGRLIQPSSTNDGHQACCSKVVKTIVANKLLARPQCFIKGNDEHNKKTYFGYMRTLAQSEEMGIYCFDRSKQDWLTSLQLLCAYEKMMGKYSEVMLESGFDHDANSIYTTPDYSTMMTIQEFTIYLEGKWAMLTSAMSMTSDGNAFKTENEVLAFVYFKRTKERKDPVGIMDEIDRIIHSWNNPDHRTLVSDVESGNSVWVPTAAAVLPCKHEGDDLTVFDNIKLFSRDLHTHHAEMAEFNAFLSTSWIPSEYQTGFGWDTVIDTLSTFYYPECARDGRGKRLATGKPDIAIVHPLKRLKSLCTFVSQSHVTYYDAPDGTHEVYMDKAAIEAIATAKISQASTMQDAIWLRRIAIRSADYFLSKLPNKDITSSVAKYDHRDPAERGLAPRIEGCLAINLRYYDDLFREGDISQDMLIANAKAWKSTFKCLNSVHVREIASELLCLEQYFDAHEWTDADFEMSNSAALVSGIAPNIGLALLGQIEAVYHRLEATPPEGSVERLSQQREVVDRILNLGSGGPKKESKTQEASANEQCGQRRDPKDSGARESGGSGRQRRGPQPSHKDGSWRYARTW